MKKDLYAILGLQKGASDADIKKAFRNLSLKYHPDRQGGKTDKEKAEAEEKFKEISGAWSILSDPNKKRQYDQFGTIDENAFNGGFNFNFENVFEDLGDIFGNIFGNRQRRQYKDPGRQKGSSVKIQIPVSIEEILNGKIDRDIEYDIDVRCPKCHGEGGSNKKSCPHCNGTGMVTETQKSPFGYFQNSHPCQYCKGTGEIFDNICNTCHGTGFVKKKQTVHVYTTNIQNGQTLMFNGKGYQSKYSSAPDGDLIVELVFQYDMNKFAIQGNTIYEKIEVPYYDCILGSTINHKYVNGVTGEIQIPQYSNDGNHIRSNKRFNNMNYEFIISVKMPKYIKESERKLLNEIKKENS